MATIRQNPQSFTAGIGSYRRHGTVGIYPLHPEPATRRCRPVNITGRLERWREYDIEMRGSLDTFQRRCKTSPPRFRADISP